MCTSTSRALYEPRVSIRRKNLDRNSDIASLINKQFWTGEEFATMTESAICAEKYKDTDEVVVLPCSNLHYFHSTCIERWLEKKKIGVSAMPKRDRLEYDIGARFECLIYQCLAKKN